MKNATPHVGHAADIARAVCDVLPGDITAALVAVLFAEQPDATAADVARWLRKDPATVRRARKRLADVDLVRAHTSVSCVSARAHTSETDAGARSDPRAHAGDPSSSSLFLETTPSVDSVDVVRSSANAIWTRKQPRPAIPYPAVVSIVRKLLDAGWPADAVVDAGIAVPTISIGWCESWLNKNRKPAVARDDSARRNGHTRVVRL